MSTSISKLFSRDSWRTNSDIEIFDLFDVAADADDDA